MQFGLHCKCASEGNGKLPLLEAQPIARMGHAEPGTRLNPQPCAAKGTAAAFEDRAKQVNTPVRIGHFVFPLLKALGSEDLHVETAGQICVNIISTKTPAGCHSQHLIGI
eukprot:1144729-Pelagomonas_calceolata.AAC.4